MLRCCFLSSALSRHFTPISVKRWNDTSFLKSPGVVPLGSGAAKCDYSVLMSSRFLDESSCAVGNIFSIVIVRCGRLRCVSGRYGHRVFTPRPCLSPARVLWCAATPLVLYTPAYPLCIDTKFSVGMVLRQHHHESQSRLSFCHLQPLISTSLLMIPPRLMLSQDLKAFFVPVKKMPKHTNS